MKVHSLKLTIQDVPDADSGELFAACFATVVLNTGEVAKNADGTDKLDEEGQPVYMMEDINTVFPLNKDEVFKGNIQAILMEALTLKNWQIAKENGQLSHFVEAVGADPSQTDDSVGAEPKPELDEEQATDSES